jgi:ATPases involved in chromosome partitioning
MAKVITVAQQKGGVGKTTLVVQLAVAFAQMGMRTMVVDVDPQGSLTKWQKLRQDKGRDNPSLLSGSAWQADSMIKKSKDYDVVLVGLAHRRADAKIAVALRASDLILLPCQPAAPDIWALDDTLGLTALHLSKLRVVLNRVPPRSSKAEQMIKELEERNLPISEVGLGNRAAFADSLAEGSGVAEAPRNSRAREEIRALANELLAY